MSEPRDSSPTSERSVTIWLEQLQAGDSAAATQLWQRYVERLVRLAHRKLGDLPRRVADEDDVVNDDTLRQIARGKLEGYTNAELATKLNLSLRAVERKLQLIRRQWSQELNG